MFPDHLRKSPPSLLSLSLTLVADSLGRYVRMDSATEGRPRLSILRRYMAASLLPEMHDRLLAELVPTARPWEYECTRSEDITRCRIHGECRNVYRR